MIQISELHAALGVLSGAVFWCLSVYLVARHSFERGQLSAMAENDRKHRPDYSAAWESAPKQRGWKDEGPEFVGQPPRSISAVSQKRVSYADELMGHPPVTESRISRE